MQLRPGSKVAEEFRWRIVETNGSGHRLWYVSLLLQRISKLDMSTRVELVSRPGIIDSPSWREHLGPWSDTFERFNLPEGRFKLGTLRQTARGRMRIVIPDGDMWLPWFILARFTARRSLAGSLLLMRPNPEANWASRRRHALKTMIIMFVRMLHPQLQILRLVAAGDQGCDGNVLDPVEFAPSGAGRRAWLEMNGLDPGLNWLVVPGEISERKCVGLVASALNSQEAQESGWGLIVIGSTNDESLLAQLAALSAARPTRIVCRNTFLSNVQFDTWVANADAISVLYRNEGSSGVLLKCWAAGTPVIAGGSKAVVQAAEMLHIDGVIVDELSSSAILDALARISSRSNDRHLLDNASWRERSNQFAEALLGLNSSTVQKVGG